MWLSFFIYLYIISEDKLDCTAGIHIASHTISIFIASHVILVLV